MINKSKLLTAILVIWLLVGLGLLCTYWEWDWRVLAGIATWVLAGGVFFAFWQINEARRSTQAQLAVELFSELRHKDVLNILREIYELKPDNVRRLPTSTNKTDVELRHRIEGVLDKFELLGALVAQGIIDKRLAIEAYGGPPILKCWYQLGENYIKKVRKKRGLFCKYVEDFAARTYEYQKKHSPKDERICFHRGERGKRINLVEYFENHPASRPKQYK